ncbi:MAG: discoidin domain-containing protein [Clostridiales bacterium]|nr:discoidin domain-containing protein [Clostridiales bacterium]
MKKALSIALTVLLSLSVLCITAFAEGETNYALEEGVEVSGVPAYLEQYNGNVIDGVIGTNSYDNKWAGFYWNNDSENNNYDGITGTIVLDLGAVRTDITSIQAHIWNAQGASGIASPESIVVLCSSDGSSYTELGSLTYGPEMIDWAVLDLDNAVEARYIKYVFNHTAGSGVFMFVSELAVYGDGTGSVADPSEAVSEGEASTDTESTEDNVSAPAESENAESSAAVSEVSGSEPASDNTVIYVIAAVVAAAIVVAVVLLIAKKKK